MGQPLDGPPRTLSRGGWQWGAGARSRKEAARPVKPVFAPAAVPAGPAVRPLPDLAAGPLSFLPVRHFFLLTALLLAVILLTWGLVRSNHLSVALSYEISELTQRKLNLLETNRQLKTELTRLGSLDQLEKAARSTLGLITPNQGQIVVIEP
ncbi:hypothetical protein FACS189460_0820 [Deltaproteobacteria bacterium]|nr:hypothetical protein FACS189460_0820 [Deltaproteobacteria bacterium]